MIPYSYPSIKTISIDQSETNIKKISSFINDDITDNIDWKTVDSFGEEWEKFGHYTEKEIESMGDEYFDIISSEMLNSSSIALDVGCGTGRWTKYVSSKAKYVESIDPSKAVLSAAKLLGKTSNVRITQAAVENIPFPDNSFDFVFSLGVLHHIPDTEKALQSCIRKLKKNGYFLVYLYYSLDNKGFLFKFLFTASNQIRKGICILPNGLKQFICDILAVLLYLPFVLISKIAKAVFGDGILKFIPLSWYHDKTWKAIRNDSLDRFGTPLEQRFTKKEIAEMMKKAGLSDIIFSEHPPFWHAVGKKI